jgi:hypothetical protein
MKNVIVYLIGPPGVGKYTVGDLLAQQIPARLVDNHYWNNPIFHLIEPDGKTPLPNSVWHLTGTVRSAVLETIATLAPRERSFVFTHAVSHSGGHPIDRTIAEQILNTAKRRNADLLIARLWCDEVTLAGRIEAPGRAARLKERDGTRAAHYVSLAPFTPQHDWVMELNTSDLLPTEAAGAILRTLRSKLG